jgi:hypothetical protein
VRETDLFGNAVIEPVKQDKLVKPVKKLDAPGWNGVMRPYVVIRESPTFTTILNR